MPCFDEEEAIATVEFLFNKLNKRYCPACAADIAGNVYMNLLLPYCKITAEQEGKTFEEVLDLQFADLRESILEFYKADAAQLTSKPTSGALH